MGGISLPTRDVVMDMDSEDEVDNLPAEGGPPSTARERRRKQNAVFDNWLISEAGQQALRSKKKGKVADAVDEELSIQSLMNKQGVEIIKSPRDYQLELFERAKKENTIAVLDTGSGKTLIGVMLLRWIIDQELEHRAAGKKPKIAFFLVASVTLVHQQFAVLNTNLDHKMARLCGSDNTDNWNKSKWSKLFAENKIIVCVAEILYQALAHSYIKMKQINLLIFDEAHHAKKNHSYARIIKDFYVDEVDDARPRIFSMTASPIDAKTDVVEAADQLETILHSRIATTNDTSLTDAVQKPNEQVLRYAPLLRPYETRLLQAVKTQYGDIKIFHRMFEKCPEIARELGPWCADHYLMTSIAEKNLKKYEMKNEQKFYERSTGGDVHELDKKQAHLRSAIEWMAIKGPELGTGNIEQDITDKVRRLRVYLQMQFERPSSHRAIVFVEARHTARLLDALFQRIGPEHMHCGFLIGAGVNGVHESSFTFRDQVLTLINFRTGVLNCLFATSIAEEGLDVPDCNLVIRFDIYRTMIQYVQSRGRARQKNSKFIHMAESANDVHTQAIHEVRYQEAAMRSFCQALPENRRLVGNSDTMATLTEKEKTMRTYTEPSTGAKLTYGNALVYLANYVSVTTSAADELQHPTYVVSSQRGKFISEVLIPCPPVRSAVGRLCTKKSLAKRSAAFEACIALRKEGHLDEHLMPTYHKKAPAMRNALLALNMNKKGKYDMRTKPTVWEQGRGVLPTELWVTIVDFPDGLERQHQPLALLTRTRMPNFPTIPIFLNNLHESTADFRSLNAPVSVDQYQIQDLSTFMFRVFKDVFSKSFEQDGSMLSYWFAPAQVSARQAYDITPGDVIDWDLVAEVSKNERYLWSPNTPNEFLADKFIVDTFHGGRKFYSSGVDPALKPTDPVPDHAAKHKSVGSILDHSVSLWKRSREARSDTWNEDQPVIIADMISLHYNLLAKQDDKDRSENMRAYICPEPLKISSLPPDFVASCYIMPAIMTRLESHLIAIEACEMLGIVCEPQVSLAAVTKDSDNSGDHGEERINFQKGMGENYERLEFIGDTFLKTATSISTFIQNPDDNEDEFHVKRMLMLCNKNLLKVAKELKLEVYIRSKAFSRRDWYPEGLKLLEGKGVNKKEEETKHTLGDKTIADVCEALIGAAFVSHDKPGEKWDEKHWENAVRAVTKLVGSDAHPMTTWDDYRKAYAIPAYQIEEVTASQRDLAEKVELEHPYHFKYPRLLRSAFTHSSQPFIYEKMPSYQRLEFLGDALLDMASITHLFYRFPDKDPQWLTEHKMAMVSNKFLGAVAVNIGFHTHLRFTHSTIGHQIHEYATELLEAKRTAGDSRDYWTTVSDPPKCISDIVESFVGAMFIDSDFDYNVVQDFFNRHMAWYFEDMSIYDTFANNHPCTHLHNLLQTSYGCQNYRLMAKEVPPADGLEMDKKVVVAAVMIHDRIIAHSSGKSGRYARVRAANNAIEVLEGLTPTDFREKFGCCCTAGVKEGVMVEQTIAVDCGI